MVNIKNVIIFCLFNASLVVLAFMTNQQLILVPVLIITLRILFCRGLEEKIIYLFYFSSFQNVLKLSPQSFSLFTILQIACLVALLITIIKNNVKISLNTISLSILFIAYLIIISILNNSLPIILIINFAIWYGTIYLVLKLHQKAFFKCSAIAFAFGVISSCVIGIFIDKIPRLNNYMIIDTIISSNTAVIVKRFLGLWNDPNDFSTFVLMAMAAVTVLFLNNKLNRIVYLLLTGSMLIFGLMSISKMFLFGAATLVLLYIVIQNSRSLKSGFASTMILLLLIIIFVFFNSSTIVDVYLKRLAPTFTNQISMNTLTTGRTEIWSMYFESMFNNISWLFGNGIDSLLKNIFDAHNTFIQMLYQIGIVGIFIYIFMLKSIVKEADLDQNDIRKNQGFLLLRLLPLLTLVWGLMSLDFFTYDVSMFFILLCVLGYYDKHEEFSKELV